MKKKITTFQMVLMGIFGTLAMIGFVLFATYSPKIEREQIIGSVVIWGTLDKDLMRPLLNELNSKNKNMRDVIYVEKSLSNYNQELLEAMATGFSPDLFLVSNRDIFKNLNKIHILNSESYSIRDFKDTFVNAFSIFTNSQGVIAIPFLIDPMVMYYNKNIFATSAVAVPPTEWEDFYRLAEKINEFDHNGNIKKSAVAFGETINVTNFKDIITTMILQVGDPIVYEGEKRYMTTTNERSVELSQILTYFTSFSNPNSKSYSWNRSLPNSLDFFISGSLATYFGFVSELKNIRLRNPNLDFDVAEMPSYRGANNKTVFARTWGLAIPKNSKNKIGAFRVANILAGEESQEFLSEKMFLPPVLKISLMNRHKDPFMDIFYRKAIHANSFMDPDYKKTTEIFKNMIDSVVSNKNNPQNSINKAWKEIDLLLQRN